MASLEVWISTLFIFILFKVVFTNGVADDPIIDITAPDYEHVKEVDGFFDKAAALIDALVDTIILLFSVIALIILLMFTPIPTAPAFVSLLILIIPLLMSLKIYFMIRSGNDPSGA